MCDVITREKLLKNLQFIYQIIHLFNKFTGSSRDKASHFSNKSFESSLFDLHNAKSTYVIKFV